jgi:hypothetical protein
MTIVRDDDRTWLWSRQKKNLTDAFPELAEAAADAIPAGCVLDEEAVIWVEGRLDFDELQRRAGPSGRAASRVLTPAIRGGRSWFRVGEVGICCGCCRRKDSPCQTIRKTRLRGTFRARMSRACQSSRSTRPFRRVLRKRPLTSRARNRTSKTTASIQDDSRSRVQSPSTITRPEPRQQGVRTASSRRGDNRGRDLEDD